MRLFFLLAFITGFVYPTAVTLVGNLLFPYQAGGSLLIEEGHVRGSTLLSQSFEKEIYFYPRPSAIEFNPLHPSGGSQLGPTSRVLKETVEKRAKAFSSPPPAELVYASGSGLEPYLSFEATSFQVERVAKARNRSVSEIAALLEEKREGKLVNILLLNKALDERF